MSVMDTSDITSKPTVKSLLVRVKASAGRNNNGRITSRHKEAGAKKLYRIIDFKRNKDSVPAKVATIEYDPNRSARIALLHYVDGEKRDIETSYPFSYRLREGHKGPHGGPEPDRTQG